MWQAAERQADLEGQVATLKGGLAEAAAGRQLSEENLAASGAQLMALQRMEGELRHDLELSQDQASHLTLSTYACHDLPEPAPSRRQSLQTRGLWQYSVWSLVCLRAM